MPTHRLEDVIELIVESKMK